MIRFSIITHRYGLPEVKKHNPIFRCPSWASNYEVEHMCAIEFKRCKGIRTFDPYSL